ncbi:cyclopropane-fatty-acyl-phospholipid synthase family protein [Labrys neptuniae]|uniref:Cyclopropane-fatty-acyl-phospholipid synthase family protein n=1 Tax=Labrys neptuniae TaxID=376174 RepID=A0ABV3PRH6_9HYPH|nr:cyclopropane-fatty-acyl-phospholipid synthase family protein [Labrys neptuniae]MDT3381829.1 cyclopropane-fatty-acyl-phospholipid synthase family protein [Labrys neptuniae]
MNLEEKRLAVTRRLVGEVADKLGADLSLELWNGEVLPLGPHARDDIRFVLRSPEAIRRMLTRPRLMTLFELYAEQEVDIVGGSPLQAAARWNHSKALATGRSFPKMKLLGFATPFLFGRMAKAAPLPSFDGSVPMHYAKGRDDKELIQFHYDVSNEFYQLFLDPEMVYSAAYFPSPEASLEDAQRTKLDRICQKLQLKPGDRLLDIGCGWGGLVCHAARHYGVTAYGVTLAQRQLEFCQAKIEREGLGDKVKVELRDYRNIEPSGQFDAVAQIEMFEHVGLKNHDRHFIHMRDLMTPDGRYLHQASVRRALFDMSKFGRETAYMRVIRRYIFPGGEMDHIGMTATNLERHGFEIHDIEPMRMHFYLTLKRWVDNLWANRERARAMVGWERTRLWLLYLSMCCISFQRGGINVFQTVATRRIHGPSILPLRRAEWFQEV